MSVDELRRMTEEHLEELVHEIEDGRCIAFVGAGFSFPAKLKGWMDLLKAATEHVPANARNRPAIEDTLSKEKASHRELEAAGQLIQDALGPARFREAVSQALKVDNDALPEAYLRRRRSLLQVPFYAILTTNFDPLLSGKLPTPSTYRRLLRGPPRGPWDRRYWPGHGDPEVVQLHGKVGTEQLVFARRDYRELLFANPGYLTFLKALFATKTVVFMGFSFRDAYVDLLRSELIQLVEPPRARSAEPPALSYAFMTELSAAEARYYREHEGMRVLYYEADDNHVALDDLLERLAGLTNPVLGLAERLSRHH
ncbi:MAG: SIR2 family protein, partial [Proteobacteria bacterium]|nr:SIR2 family protein [Pseudomonadota bacterium]